MYPLDSERLFPQIQGFGVERNQQVSSSDPERQALGQVLAELQCSAFAIDQAASLIRENSPMTFREYLTYLKPRSIDRDRLLRFKQANPTYPDSVMTTWEISLQYLERTQPRAGWILHFLGFLDPPYIPEKLLTRVTETIPWSFDKTLAGKQLPFKYRTLVAFFEKRCRIQSCDRYFGLLVTDSKTSVRTYFACPPYGPRMDTRSAEFKSRNASKFYHSRSTRSVPLLTFRGGYTSGLSPTTFVSRNTSERID